MSANKTEQKPSSSETQVIEMQNNHMAITEMTQKANPNQEGDMLNNVTKLSFQERMKIARHKRDRHRSKINRHRKDRHRRDER